MIDFLLNLLVTGQKFIGVHNLVVVVLIDAIVIIIASRAVGWLCKKGKQPLVIGEITAGILLGPSFLGLIAPGFSALLFPPEIIPHLNVLAQIGLIFFMFLIGLELNPKYLSEQIDRAVLISHVSILVPFSMGAYLAILLYPQIGLSEVSFTAFALFLGAAMSITAFPVLARIITENNLQNTKLGTLALTCAAVDDVTAWCVLAVAIAVARTNDFVTALPTVGFAIVFIAGMIFLARPLLKGMERIYTRTNSLSEILLAATYVGVVMCSLATEYIGIHFIFGAFLLGAVMPKNEHMVREISEKTEDFVLIFFMPLFFAYSGLRTQIGLLNSARLWALCGAVLLVAIAGKYIGTYIAARYTGSDNREASALGWMMNTRGLTELIVLNIGLSLGVISPELFAMMVIMALVTTFMASPLLEFTYPKNLIKQNQNTNGSKNLVPTLTGLIYNPQELRQRFNTDVNCKILVLMADPQNHSVLLAMASFVAGKAEYQQAPYYYPYLVPNICISIFPTQIQVANFIELDTLGFHSVPARLPNVDSVVTNTRKINNLIKKFKIQKLHKKPPVVETLSSVFNDMHHRVKVLLEESTLTIIGSHNFLANTNIDVESEFEGNVTRIMNESVGDVGIFIKPAKNFVSDSFKVTRLLVSYSGTSHDVMALGLALKIMLGNPDIVIKLTVIKTPRYLENYGTSPDLYYATHPVPVINIEESLLEVIKSLPADMHSRVEFESFMYHDDFNIALWKMTQDYDLVLTGIDKLGANNNNDFVKKIISNSQAPVLLTHSKLGVNYVKLTYKKNEN